MKRLATLVVILIVLIFSVVIYGGFHRPPDIFSENVIADYQPVFAGADSMVIDKYDRIYLHYKGFQSSYIVRMDKSFTYLDTFIIRTVKHGVWGDIVLKDDTLIYNYDSQYWGNGEYDLDGNYLGEKPDDWYDIEPNRSVTTREGKTYTLKKVLFFVYINDGSGSTVWKRFYPGSFLVFLIAVCAIAIIITAVSLSGKKGNPIYSLRETAKEVTPYI